MTASTCERRWGHDSQMYLTSHACCVFSGNTFLLQPSFPLHWNPAWQSLTDVFIQVSWFLNLRNCKAVMGIVWLVSMRCIRSKIWVLWPLRSQCVLLKSEKVLRGQSYQNELFYLWKLIIGPLSQELLIWETSRAACCIRTRIHQSSAHRHDKLFYSTVKK